MSSRTRTRFRICSEDRHALSLNAILGEGGREMLSKTLDSLVDRKHGMLIDQRAEALLDWKRADRDGMYRLILTSPNLPAALQQGGIQQIQVDLNLTPGMVMINQQINAVSTNQTLSNPVQVEAEHLVNRSVNRLLAITVAQSLEQKLRNQNQIKMQAVQMHVSEVCDVRAYAHVRH
ncbi:MAG TPA: hypothetical protein VHY08_12575 [Bacillota bacterium]|nr:hypothetical protein [Bacillota bacterium]